MKCPDCGCKLVHSEKMGSNVYDCNNPKCNLIRVAFVYIRRDASLSFQPKEHQSLNGPICPWCGHLIPEANGKESSK